MFTLQTNPLQSHPANGFHADGHEDYLNAASTEAGLHFEKAKLHRRIKNLCHPRHLLGHFILFSRRRRLLSQIHKRFKVPYALFLTQNIW